MELAKAQAMTVDSMTVDPTVSRAAAMLAVEGVTIRFGGVTALENVSFRVAPGVICGLIGPNGAGKTTIFNCLSRLYEPQPGRSPSRQAARKLSRARIASLGIGRTFQNVALFADDERARQRAVGGHALGTGGSRQCLAPAPRAARRRRSPSGPML